MIFSLYFVYFIEASFIGWVWECTYNAVKQHRWENRGFLFGPVIPIYGVGTVPCGKFFSFPSLAALFLNT